MLASTAGTPFLFTATFSMITGFVGRPNYLTWSQVSALDHSGLPRPRPRLPALGAWFDAA